jgi:predicted unusual protein kinase regulating ubiquinone biosynthesis (AarF/ABC1/UbiB family)
MPSILMMPLFLFDSTRDFYLNTFLESIKRAGVVWIKAFQYLSHRRDIIGPDMADKFAILR